MMIALDFETTALTGPVNLPLIKQPYIIEYTFAILDDVSLKELRRESSLIKPGIRISDEITKITGLTNAQLDEAKPFAFHYQTWCEIFLGAKAMVSHNCFFEAACMEVELKRIGRLTQFPWPPERHCTVELTTHLKGRRLKQSELFEIATGKPPNKAHRTDDDVTSLITNVRWLRKQKILL